MCMSVADKSHNPHMVPCIRIICKSEKSYFTELVSLLIDFFTIIVIFSNMCFIIIYWIALPPIITVV